MGVGFRWGVCLPPSGLIGIFTICRPPPVGQELKDVVMLVNPLEAGETVEGGASLKAVGSPKAVDTPRASRWVASW